MKNRIRGETNRYLRTLRQTLALLVSSGQPRFARNGTHNHQGTGRHSSMRRLTGERDRTSAPHNSPPLSASKSVTSLKSLSSAFSLSSSASIAPNADSKLISEGAETLPDLKQSILSSTSDEGSDCKSKKSLTTLESGSNSPPLIPTATTVNDLQILNTASANSIFLQYQSRLEDLSPVMQNMVTCFLNRHKQLDYLPSLVHLCGPLALAISEESDAYWAFEALMQEVGPHFHSMRQRTTQFLMLFQLVLADLYNHFEDEEVEMKDWADSWCSGLLAKELPLKSLLSLWDRYFAARGGISGLHTCVCLVILRNLKETLEGKHI